MSDFRGMMKSGWHPKGKDGGKESWRGDFKGINQVAGWVGKGKSSETQAAREHVSRPLGTLKDPALFGPPPKNVNYHGGAALPNEITPHRSGLGAPLTQQQIESAQQAAVAQEEEEVSQKPAPPSLPYRANTTGLRTDNLPPPPVHRDIGQSTLPPPPPSRATPARAPPPLPTRRDTTSPPVDEAPPPAYEALTSKPASSGSFINQSAVTSLGRAGVKVPGLGIGNNNNNHNNNSAEQNPWASEQSQTQSPATTNHLSTLQSRFSRLNTSSPSSSPTTASNPSPNQSSMPSFQQSQSAFQTAQNLRSNPQNVTVADAQSAAQTANQAQRSASAFRERHADSIANAQAKAKVWDQKYKVTSKLNKFLDEHSENEQNQTQAQQGGAHAQYQPQQQQQQQQQQQSSGFSPPPVPQHPSVSPGPSQPVQSPQPVATDFSATSIARKPPPPPAPRKPANLQAPPPVPTGTKPSFG